MSKKLDCARHGIFSYQFERARGPSQSVDERTRIVTTQLFFPMCYPAHLSVNA